MLIPFKILWRVVKAIWQTINFIRRLLFSLLALVIVIFIIILFISMNNTSINFDKSVLVLNLQGSISDQAPNEGNILPLEQKINNLYGKLTPNSVFDITNAIEAAKTDKRITGIVLDLDNLSRSDLTLLSYIGKKLNDFKESGKPIYAIGQNFDQNQYYLASFADKIYLQPQGAVNLYGFSANSLYFKSLLDKLNITVNIFRVGNYKSAVEPFMRDNMSDDARENTNRWISHLWQQYLKTLSTNRHIATEKLMPNPSRMISLLQNQLSSMADYAKTIGLVDEVCSYPEFEQTMIRQFGWNSEKQQFNQISYYRYLDSLKQTKSTYYNNQTSVNDIAVIFIKGNITDENTGNTDNAEKADIIKQIRNARLNDNIKAVILRVNSPGGSVTAAEAIRNELIALKETGKPIVVSMGSMAASGGYWISTPADYIIANPTTITGSIGVFGMIPTFEKTLNSIGVHSDGVETTTLAGLTVTKALTPDFKKIMQLSVENNYLTFINLVAQARHKTLKDVDHIAQGQVWIGQDALTNQLVDELGDIDTAISKAAELAKLDNYNIYWMTTDTSLLPSFVLGLHNHSLISAPLSGLLGVFATPVQETTQQFNALAAFDDPQHNYVYCLECSIIH